MLDLFSVAIHHNGLIIDHIKCKAHALFRRFDLEQFKDGLYQLDNIKFAVFQVEISDFKFGDKIKTGKDSVFPFIIDDIGFEELPEFLGEIFSYRYEDKCENVKRLVDDIVFWKNESSRKKNRKTKSCF